MPRNLWDPMGLPELEDIEQEELAPQPKEVLQQKSGIAGSHACVPGFMKDRQRMLRFSLSCRVPCL